MNYTKVLERERGVPDCTVREPDVEMRLNCGTV